MDVHIAKNGNRGPNHDCLASFGQTVDSPLFSITGKHNYISSCSLSVCIKAAALALPANLFSDAKLGATDHCEVQVRNNKRV